MPRPPPQGGPPQVMHNDPRGPRPDWNRPPGNIIVRCFNHFCVTKKSPICMFFIRDFFHVINVMIKGMT